MKNTTQTVSGLLIFAIFCLFGCNQKESSKNDSVEELRVSYKNHLKNNPYSETLKLSRKERKAQGLPPNKYFEQMWELTIDPRTGKLDDGNLTLLREQLIQQRQTERNPGEVGNEWVERGPNNIGGRTRVIMFDPNDPTNNTVYAGGVSGGLWINTDITNSNSTWSRVQNVPGNLSVTSITVDPRDSDTWYVGTGEQYTAGDVVGNGVYYTTDGGINWSALTIPDLGGGDINLSANDIFLSGIYYVNDVLAWDNGTSTELFVAIGAHAHGNSSNPTNWLGLQSAGLYHSTDGGTNWSRIQSANMQYTFGGQTYYYIPNDLEIGADNTLWMGTISSVLGSGGGRVYSSINGSTWTEAAGSPLPNSNRVEIEPSSTNANKLYALVQGTSNPVYIYETTDKFATTTALALPNDADTNISATDFTRGQAFYDLVIEADPADDDIVYVGGIDLFKTTDGGSSWNQISHWYGGFGFQYVHADQHAIAFANNSSSRMVFGNDGGIYYSNNSGGTISVRNTEYNVTQYVKAGIGPDGAGDTDGIFTAGAQDNGSQAFRNTVPGINSGEALSDGDGFYTFVDKDGDYMIATYVGNVIYRFNLPWNGLSRIQGGSTTLVNDQSTGDFVNQMDYDSDANRLLSNNSSGSSYAIRSINVAANSNGSITNAALTAKPTAFRASPFETNAWYVGLADGGLVKLTSVTNNSATWSTITTPFVGAVSSVRFGATLNDIIVTIHNYGVDSVWYSDDAGANWSSKEGDLPNIPVRDFLLNPLNNQEAILATQLGVWATTNFGDPSPNWVQSYNGMSDVSVTSFDYWAVGGDDANNKIIASTYGRGVFTGSFISTDLTAIFSADNLTPNTVQTVTFTDASINGATSWTWSFSPNTVTYVNGTNANSQNPQVTFDAAGAYTVTLTVGDGVTTDDEVKTNYINVSLPSYCDSEFSSATSTDEYIDAVVFADINNTGTGTTNGVGYSDFTAISTDVERGSTYNLSVTVFANYDEYASVWFDWNQDYMFDASEKYELGFYADANGNVTNDIDILIPNDAVLGNTRMRITEQYEEVVAGPCTSDHANNYGETEDYTINILEGTLSSKDLTFDAVGLKLFPTVSNGTFNITSKSFNGDLNIQVYNINGKKVFENKVQISASQQKEINLNGNASGMYLVNISNGTFSKTQKVIIK